MPTYNVTWHIDIDAKSHEEAAAKAREIQLDPTSEATFFEVRLVEPGKLDRRTIELPVKGR